MQLSAGVNIRSHLAGAAGLEHTLQLNGSFFNLGNVDFFQNALVSYQASLASPLGREFRFLGNPKLRSYLQGSVFAQIGAVVGANYDNNVAGERKMYIGFMVQPGFGAQLTLNVWKIQVIVQGSVVYSWLSSTAEKDSTPMSNVSGQAGVGIGYQF